MEKLSVKIFKESVFFIFEVIKFGSLYKQTVKLKIYIFIRPNISHGYLRITKCINYLP